MEKSLSALAADFIEACRRESREKFLGQMQQVHPTLQQVFAGLVFVWLNTYADQRSDDRNKASIDFTSELRDIYRSATENEGFKDRFPFI